MDLGDEGRHESVDDFDLLELALVFDVEELPEELLFLVKDESSVADDADVEDDDVVVPKGKVVELILVFGNQERDLVFDFLFNDAGVVEIVEDQNKVHLKQFQAHNVDFILA